jgi:hypothetical protein
VRHRVAAIAARADPPVRRRIASTSTASVSPQPPSDAWIRRMRCAVHDPFRLHGACPRRPFR